MLQSISMQDRLRLGFGLLVMAYLLLDLPLPPYGDLVIALIAYAAVAYKVVISAFSTLFKRRRMSEQFLMTVATFGAFMLHDYPEALAVMIFYLIGELFEDYASGKAHREITSLVKLKPSFARLVDKDGNEKKVRPRQVKIGDTIRVLAGEAVALDGTLKTDSAVLDMSALTGESYPQRVKQGDNVMSGSINLGKVFELTVTCDSKSSSITRLINLIEDASANKSRPEALITRFAVWYTPIVVALAALMALAPFALPWLNLDKSDYVTRALIFLVVSCPCALVLSVPLSFFGGLGAISKIGVMVKGSVFIEGLSKLKTLCFDKTGTITRGKFAVSQIADMPEKLQQDKAAVKQLLSAMSGLESKSAHPIAQAICAYVQEQGIEPVTFAEVTEKAGNGISATADGLSIAAGRREYISEVTGHDIPAVKEDGTAVYMALNGEYAGCMLLRDEIKPEAYDLMKGLKKLGVKSCLITGDNKREAELIASKLGISEVHAQMLPQDKLAVMNQIRAKDGLTGFTGDGINDAPVLSAADVGIAMGKGGTALAVEASDVVVMNDDLRKIPLAIQLSRKTVALAMQNMIFVIAVKAIILILGALGIANIWLAILGDVGLCVLAVLNAMRAMTFVKASEADPAVAKAAASGNTPKAVA